MPRVRHVVTETARTRAAAAALARAIWRRWAAAGRGARVAPDDYRSTVPEAEFIVERAVALGAHGRRLTGAGWGGAVVVLARPDREARILAEVCAIRRQVRAGA